jgi:opacity protein-like surface antigen
MTKKATVLAVVIMTTFMTSAQVIEITPSYGYQFGTRLNYGLGYVKAEPSGQWGIAAGVEARPGIVVKLSYTSMGTESRVRDIDIENNREVRLSDLQNDWFLLGVQRYLNNGKVKPFVGGGLGLVVVSPKNENTLNCTGCLPQGQITPSLSSNTYFAFNFEAGANIMFSDVVGLNLQGNLYFPVNYGGFYVGTGGAGFSTGSTQIIGGFSGGLVFRIDAN